MSVFPFFDHRSMGEVAKYDWLTRISRLQLQIAAELRRLATMPIDELRAMPGTAVNYIR